MNGTGSSNVKLICCFFPCSVASKPSGRLDPAEVLQEGLKAAAYFSGQVWRRTYLLLLAAISSLIFLMSLLHFSISTTFRPSTVNKGKHQGCYHGETQRLCFHNCAKSQRALTGGAVQRASEPLQPAPALAHAGAAKGIRLENP